MTTDTALIRSFAKRLAKSENMDPKDANNTLTGGRTKNDHKCEVVHPGLDHSQWALGEKKDMPAYGGGAPARFGQGSKSMKKELIGRVYCSWCHKDVGISYTPYRGQQICKSCWARYGPPKPIMKGN